MRLFFGIMLALCILLFVAIQWGGMLAGAGKVSQANGEMYPEKIILLDTPLPASHVASPALSHVAAVSAVVPAPAVSAVPATTAVSAASPASPAAHAMAAGETTVPKAKPGSKTGDPAKPAVPVSPAVLSKPVTPVCMDWGEFAGTDLQRADKLLIDLKLGDRLSHHTVEYDTGYWVYVDPLKSKAALNRKIAELKKLGISEFYVLRDARKWHNAISFGIFKSIESARQWQAELRKKGLHTHVGERKSKLKYTIFSMKGISEQEQGRLTKLQKEFPNSELKKTACH